MSYEPLPKTSVWQFSLASLLASGSPIQGASFPWPIRLKVNSFFFLHPLCVFVMLLIYLLITPVLNSPQIPLDWETHSFSARTLIKSFRENLHTLPSYKVDMYISILTYLRMTISLCYYHILHFCRCKFLCGTPKHLVVVELIFANPCTTTLGGTRRIKL